MLDGKRLIITGATSGIGRATAIAAAAHGASVVVTGRREAEAAALVAELAGGPGAGELADDGSAGPGSASAGSASAGSGRGASGTGGRFRAIVGDVAEPEFAGRLVDDAVGFLGGLDGVVNAAGIIVRATAEATTDEDWARQMAVNVDAVFRISRAAVPHLRASAADAGTSAIVNVSSTCGKVGAAGLAGYCASKGAVISLTQAMALELGPDQVRVNAVCPGAIDTPMLAGGHAAGVTVEQVRAANRASIPQNRIPGPDEVADLIVFLLADQSRHITGADIAIDGGYTSQ